ncbi:MULTISPECIES: hypothetical protein [Ensifer]|jgi:hypothetical protein|uniref:hypothetical protein n=1 Tax=Ensifer TaxID=106591 RepID=UPI0007142606|nr:MULTISPECIES: hypothetical protein [Ensifer]KQX43179.1 hypothetical protein ASD49_10980 [Ensifer sp. Root1298]KQX72728.1 hypothetical protein ASD41_11480 [Ensifer sp. Root1312]KRC15694.1 hypothetical protein ASE29_11035 [Ensifer sp. Root74]KRD58969.1 hypothetical protein ASE71_09110 [Ensifer sp. Root954]
MSQSTLRTIWMTAALLIFVFVFNMYGGTQKAEFSLGITLPIEFKAAENITPVGYALHGLRAIALFFWAIPFLAWIHARGESGSAASAFPFRLLDIAPASKPGVVVQVLAFLLLILFPLGSAYHFWQILERRAMVCRPDPATPCQGIWSRPEVPAGFWDHTYRLTEGASNNGPTYEPIIEPVLASVMLIVAIGFVGLLLREMYRAQNRPATVGHT